MRTTSPRIAISDIAAALKRYQLVGSLGWQDVRQRYRRSALGPFWLTLSMGIMILTIGIVFGQIFNTSITDYLPFVTAGVILWGFISTVISEGCLGFVVAEGVIKQLPIPLFLHILRLIWRNILILGHNIVIFPIVLLFLGRPVDVVALVSLVGLAVLIVNLSWIALVLAMVCARYRDLPQIVASVLQVFFYLTPIMWMPTALPQQSGLYLLSWNPAYHLLEIVRSPLLGRLPTSTNWKVAILLAFVGWAVAIVLFGRYRRRIAYWL